MHLIVTVEGNELTHERFIEQVENTKYPFEGKNHSGYTRPNISEIKTYDIRIQEEWASQLMKDLKIKLPEEFGLRGNSKHHLSSPFNMIKGFLITLFRKFFGFCKVDRAKKPSKYSKPHIGWAYKVLVGAKKDPKKDDKDLL